MIRKKIGLAPLTGLLLFVALSLTGCDLTIGQSESEASPSPSASASTEPSTTPSPSADACPTWEQEALDHANNRWFAKGILEIRNAKTDDEAMLAAHAWLNEVRKDPGLAAVAIETFTDEEIDDPSTLFVDGCATDETVALMAKTELAIAGAKSVTAGEAPANGYNTGVKSVTGDTGTMTVVVGADQPGISGDRKAIRIELEDGTVIWVMARCGNIVTEAKPPLPPGPTDEKDACPNISGNQPSVPDGYIKKNNKCLEQKSTDVNDYRRPGDDGAGADVGTGTKPRVPTVTTPAETTPPAVKTETSSGGNGVTDSVTKSPGTETGVTAPGASPAPTTKPSLPPDEGGTTTDTSDNDATDGVVDSGGM